MPTPDGTETVLQGQLGIGMLGDVRYRKIVDHKADGQTGKSRHHEHETRERQGARHAAPERNPALRPGQTQHAQHQRDHQREGEGQLAKFGNHEMPSCFAETVMLKVPMMRCNPPREGKLRTVNVGKPDRQAVFFNF